LHKTSKRFNLPSEGELLKPYGRSPGSGLILHPAFPSGTQLKLKLRAGQWLARASSSLTVAGAARDSHPSSLLTYHRTIRL